jgi:16S rRNA (adenine(1408)-N(1))-methyltransferase
VIGVDTCRDNMRVGSRTAPENALFLVADALALPGELQRLATSVTVNFPWGSLLRGLLDGHPGLLAGLRAVGRAGLSLEVRLNAGALADAGWTIESGGAHLAIILRRAGFAVRAPAIMTPAQLRAYPTTWAKRLAFGRDPRAIQFDAVLA